MLLPGLIDMHVHLRDPGQTEKEDFLSGTSAALAGGFTVIADMPNNKTPIFTYDLLVEKIQRAKEKAVCTVLFYFGTMGNNFEEFEKVYPFVAGLKIYLDNTTGGFTLNVNKLLSVYNAWKSEKPILVHSENEHFKTLIDIVRKTKKQTHICHIPSQQMLEAIIEAKKEGLPISCGVTPHHLFLTDTDGEKLGPFGLMKPPLMQKNEVDYLWKNLEYIDVVESDHAPHTKEEKEGANPPFGVPGLETTLPLLLNAVNENRLAIKDVVRLCYEGPRTILHLKNSAHKIVTIDMDEEYIMKGYDLKTKCKWTPFEGWKLKGRIVNVKH